MSPSAASSGNALTGGSSSTSPHPLGIPSSDLKPAVTRKPKTRKQNQQTKENKLIVEICKQLEQQANIRTTKQNKNQKNKKTKKQKNKKTKQTKKTATPTPAQDNSSHHPLTTPWLELKLAAMPDTPARITVSHGSDLTSSNNTEVREALARIALGAPSFEEGRTR